MITIGPITIMSTKTRRAYRELANKAYALHQTVHYLEDLGPAQEALRALDAELSDAISHVPASDIDSP